MDERDPPWGPVLWLASCIGVLLIILALVAGCGAAREPFTIDVINMMGFSMQPNVHVNGRPIAMPVIRNGDTGTLRFGSTPASVYVDASPVGGSGPWAKAKTYHVNVDYSADSSRLIAVLQ